MLTILLTLAAAAADPKPEYTATPAPTGTATAAAQPAAMPKRRYCVSETLTGTRVRQKICRTRQEWQDIGVDVTR